MVKLNPNKVRIFSGLNSKTLTQRICNHLQTEVGKSTTEIFPDGEIMVKVDDDVRGRDCFIVLSTSQPINDNLMELMIFIDCLKRASARQIIIVVPYLAYSRQDRKNQGRVPITAKLVANILTTAGADRVIALDLHTAQIQGFYDIPMDHLSATPVFLEYFRSRSEEMENLCVLSPDVGNAKVAEGMANLLGGDMAIINKKRLSGSKTVSDRKIIGDVNGKTVLMFDDMISTGSTMIDAAKVALDGGAKKIIAAATHGLFSGRAVENLAASPITQIITTNSIPTAANAGKVCEKFIEVCIANLLGDAIYRVHFNFSVSEMFNNGAGVKR
jgi:ribose-phosphate pyrophosphokinase